MAITHIHPITQTIAQAIDYGMNDKVETRIKNDIADSISYAINDKSGEVVYKTLTGTLNCTNPMNPVDSFKYMMNRYGIDEVKYGNAQTKDGKPILAWHLIQSFDEENVDPVIANQIGLQLAEEIFKDHPCVVSTHTNTENIHNHIIVCAWNLDGRKWNQCNDNYRLIRSTSDRLCEENGLSVLEHTRKQKLVRWTDKDGVVRYYEPTDRKNAILQARKEGKASPDDVGSYRNTIQYEVDYATKRSHALFTREAIDECLNYATSYEHLLAMMRERGFTIKDKKANGQWREHITFIPPIASKGVRDYKLDEDGMYTRENLTLRINSRNKILQETEALLQRIDVPCFDEYRVGETDVDRISEDYRVDRHYDSYKVFLRSGVEKELIRDIKEKYSELGVYDTTELRKRAAEIEEEKQMLIKTPKRKRDNTDELIIRIQDGYDNLKFVERKQISSHQQVFQTIDTLKSYMDLCNNEILRAEQMIKKARKTLDLPEDLKAARERLATRMDDPEYIFEEYQEDLLRDKYGDEIIRKNKLDTPEGMEHVRNELEKYEDKANLAKEKLNSFGQELFEYERCARVFQRIERERLHKQEKIAVKNLSKDHEDKIEIKEEKKKKKERER